MTAFYAAWTALLSVDYPGDDLPFDIDSVNLTVVDCCKKFDDGLGAYPTK